MSFLAPLFWSALLLALPVIVFYLIREQPRRRLVSTLLFWEDLRPKIHERPLWRKLRRWLSLLLQLLFLTLLVAALTRPVSKWEAAGARARIFVLDGSVSMETRDVHPNRFETGRAFVRERIRAMGAGDEAALILAAETPRILSGWTDGKRRLLEALETAAPGELGADPRGAVRLARELAATRDNATVVFVTDAVWDRELDPDFLAEVEIERIGEEPINAGISLFAARRSLTAPGEYSVVLRVDAAGAESLEGEVELWRNEALLDAQAVTLTPGTSWERTWNFRSEEAARLEARLVGFEGDQLAADDSRELTVEPLPWMDVILVSPPDGFLEAVFAAVPRTNVVRVWPPEDVGAGDPERFFVFNQAVPPPEFRHGGLLLIAPEEEGFWGRPLGPIEEPLVTSVDEAAAMVRFASLEQVRLGGALAYEPPPGAETYAASFDHPLVFGRWRGETPWAVIGFDLSRGDFVLRAAFPVMMSNLVQTLREGREEGLSAEVPGRVQTRLAAQDTGDTAAAARGPALGFGARPLWWWLAMLGVVWVFGEWWSYHRRITE